MPKLIITADDCGLTEAINQEAGELHQRGYISAASVMTNYPAYEHALALFRARPELDLGIHLSLTDGHPVSGQNEPHPHLLDEDFSFRGNLSLYMRSHFFSASAAAWIRNELDAQLRRFTDAGLAPRHISTHHHFHSIPLLRRIVHEMAKEHRVIWVRAHDFRANVSPHNFLLRRQRQLENGAFNMPDYVMAIQACMNLSVADFCARITRLSGTIEIVVHPAPRDDPDFPADWHYGIAPRRAETRFLIQAIDRLRDLGIIG
ncbi:MAG: ChbG/HpnK family deacetylase [Chloroflexota bacterium]|nr:ChbG/HpnK family deacetylase [Chloroflexota bacterium]MDE2907711.1 ChbG/HpnK family deacetylase [Chloroflexota bacterium]